MDRSLVDTETIVRTQICGVCTDRTQAGTCGLESASECALFRFFPQVVRAIRSARSGNVDQYVEAIRRQVCDLCADQAADGSCQRRTHVQCPLDAYLLLVVEAVEEAAAITRRKPGTQSASSSGSRSTQPEIAC